MYSNICSPNDWGHLTQKQEALRQELVKEIRAVEAARDSLESERRRLEGTDFSEFTADDMAAAQRMPTARAGVMQRELALRTRLNDEWERVRTNSLAAALQKAEAEAVAIAAEIEEGLRKLGFIDEIEVSGIIVSTMPSVGHHPRVKQANAKVAEIHAHRSDNSAWHANRKEIAELERQLAQVKSRVVAAAVG